MLLLVGAVVLGVLAWWLLALARLEVHRVLGVEWQRFRGPWCWGFERFEQGLYLWFLHLGPVTAWRWRRANGPR